ncbi:MAG: DUF1064 domain-containing protein [Bacteroidetes bacterium]|nr:MAG: DUF1064 domain-containing protein [Bacteroidota bacterium]REK06017.1 MAG: DUF1064 domain-containing protein [Bacteroidota bacterium]REK37075.1 MAG: DUF1064 domain-containing protein [Bacteroidota bacterium]REK47532.1 MAG: DUF1064 domain-containing protein [Bacteroidota bacterium]
MNVQKTLKKGKRSKYKNARTEIGGVNFDSKKEANRAMELVLLQRAGRIKELKYQVRFPLRVNGRHVCDYVADFVYFKRTHNGAETEVVEDVKSVITRKNRVYILKKKLMLAVHGIDIHEV